MQRQIHTERTHRVHTTWYELTGELGGVSYMFMRSMVPRLEWTRPVDLSIHARRPLYDDHISMENCELLGGRCYHSSSYKLAADIYTRFKVHGDPERLWQDLERYYATTFLL